MVGLKPKERELNEVARLYGMLTLKARLYFVSTEANLASGIKYLDSQAMLESENELIARQLAIDAAKQDSSLFTCVYIILDFSKWNFRMTRQNTKRVFESLDRMYGMESGVSLVYAPIITFSSTEPWRISHLQASMTSSPLSCLRL